MSALTGRRRRGDVNDELRATDQKVNRLEREIRRELVVHASVFGAIDTPAVLVYMSIVKDVERVGDYAKNLVDLALDGANFSTALRTRRSGARSRRDVSQYITDAGRRVPRARRRRCSADAPPQGDELLTSSTSAFRRW
jgi:phosphate uptake regulator